MIDAHQHLWDPTLRPYPWMADNTGSLAVPFTPHDLLGATEGLPIDGTVLVQALSSDEETDWLLQIAGQTSLIKAVVGWVAVDSPDIADRLAELQQRSALLRGIRHQVHDEQDPNWLTRPTVTNGLSKIRDSRLPFDLLIRRREIPAALKTAERFPDLTLVVDHAAKPSIANGDWSGWRAALATLAQHPSVVCKISGLVTEAIPGQWRTQNLERYVQEIVDIFGPSRCMFGSDWPVSTLEATYDEVFALVDRGTQHLSESERHDIFHATAVRTYGLEISA